MYDFQFKCFKAFSVIEVIESSFSETFLSKQNFRIFYVWTTQGLRSKFQNAIPYKIQ